MVSEARKKRWWRNLREPARVELLLRGQSLSGVATIVPPSSPAFASRVEDTLRRVPGMRRVFRVDFDPAAGLTPDQLAHLAEVFGTADAREGLSSVLEGRRPAFKGA